MTPEQPLPPGPWIASEQYGRLRFILSQDSQIVLKCSHLPYGMVNAMTEAANRWMMYDQAPYHIPTNSYTSIDKPTKQV